MLDIRFDTRASSHLDESDARRPRSEGCGVASANRAPSVAQGSGGSASATSGCGLGGCRVPVDASGRESSGTKPGSTRSTLVEVTATARVPTSTSMLGPAGLSGCFDAPVCPQSAQSHATPNGEACKANQPAAPVGLCGEPATSRSGKTYDALLASNAAAEATACPIAHAADCTACTVLALWVSEEALVMQIKSAVSKAV
jgi:hypothetical protein